MKPTTDLDAVQQLCDAASELCGWVSPASVAAFVAPIPQMAEEIRELRARQTRLEQMLRRVEDLEESEVLRSDAGWREDLRSALDGV